MANYIYDQTFHDYTLQQSMASAQPIIAIVKTILPIESVLDVGCSRGAWLRAWCDNGIKDYLGIDGDFLDQQTLLIDPHHFMAHDLSRSLQLGRTFDLVQCLEVAEHLPSDRAAGLVADLTSHGSVVLFSAAPPGQGGEHHINEKPYAYWRDLFAAHDFVLIDCLRPLLHQISGIAPWYRYNTFLFLHRDKLSTLPAFLRFLEIHQDAPIPDVSSSFYQMRKQLVRLLPSFVLHGMSNTRAFKEKVLKFFGFGRDIRQ